MRLFYTSLLTASLAALPCVASAADISTAQPVPYFPQSDYRPDISPVPELLGHQFGERISEPAAISRFFEQLASRYPQQVKLVHYGKSWQGRPLFYAVIGSSSNISQLAEIEAGMRKLAEPASLSEPEAKQLIASLPASVWIAGSLHGNEISPADAAMALAYHLLADQSALTQQILSNTLVYIDPLQNPDGHHRFVSRYYATVGLEHSPDRLSAEQNEPWPNGRTNHYLFDMNRDWISLTQPETASRVKALQQMYPLLFVDSHEMGGDMGYYFSPEAEPYNPHIQASQRQVLNKVGRNNAKWFDELGYHYFTREIFDAFYPGYGASWPLYYGSVSMTYEMASARGHHYRMQDGQILTFADGIQRNFVAFKATLETASQQASTLLQNFYQYRKTAAAQGEKDGLRSFIFAADRDLAGHQKLMGVLTQHGIKVEQAQQAFRACGKDYQAGSYLIRTNQPSYHLMRTLLDDTVPMDKAFLEQQEQRRANNLPDQIYDVTAWSLPLMYNLEMQRCNQAPRVNTTVVGPDTLIDGSVSNPDARYGFVVPWGDMAAARFLSAALQQGLTLRSSDLPFTHQNGQRYPAGTLVLSRADNPADLTTKVQQLAQQSGARIQGLDNSWVTEGPNFGSFNVPAVPKINVAMLWDEPTNPLSAGSARFVLERGIGYPVTAIRPAQLRSADLSRYQVLILPATGAGSYQQALGSVGSENLRQFVQRGGVLITLGNATSYLLEGDKPLLSSKREYQVSEQDKPASETRVPGRVLSEYEEFSQMLKPYQADPDWVPGFIANAVVDQNHWLTAGIAEQVRSLYVGNHIYQPLRINDGRNVVNFAAPKDLLAGGFVWEENRQQIAHKPLVMVQSHGRGQVIAFTQEPNFRAYVDGMHLLYINAVFRGAAHAGALR